MKKVLVITLIAAVMLVGLSVAAKADSMNATVPLTVTIPAQFGFQLTKYAHDFGSVDTGSGGETTIGIFCRSNHGLVWKLQAQAAEFENGNGDILPSDPNFVMASWTDADDPLTPLVDEGAEAAQGTGFYAGPVPSTMAYDFYESTVAEGGDPFVPITVGLYLNIPNAQASGLYSTDLIITMYE